MHADRGDGVTGRSARLRRAVHRRPVARAHADRPAETAPGARVGEPRAAIWLWRDARSSRTIQSTPPSRSFKASRRSRACRSFGCVSASTPTLHEVAGHRIDAPDQCVPGARISRSRQRTSVRHDERPMASCVKPLQQTPRARASRIGSPLANRRAIVRAQHSRDRGDALDSRLRARSPRSIRPYCGREMPTAPATACWDSPLPVRARLNSSAVDSTIRRPRSAPTTARRSLIAIVARCQPALIRRSTLRSVDAATTTPLPDHVRSFLAEPPLRVDRDRRRRRRSAPGRHLVPPRRRHIVINSLEGRLWPTNLRRDPRVSIAITATDARSGSASPGPSRSSTISGRPRPTSRRWPAATTPTTRRTPRT